MSEKFQKSVVVVLPIVLVFAIFSMGWLAIDRQRQNRDAVMAQEVLISDMLGVNSQFQ